jgi:hypothetical protein
MGKQSFGISYDLNYYQRYGVPPNTRMQPTAFGARDRCYFDAYSCSAPSAAADTQAVRPPLLPTLGDTAPNMALLSAFLDRYISS